MAESDGQLSMQLAAYLDRYYPQLVLTYQHRLYAFALRQCGSPQDAEDIVQEAFIRAYYALGDYPPERIRFMKLQAWLYKITLNVFYGRLRKNKLECVPLDSSEENTLLDIEDDWRTQPDSVVEDREGIRELEALVHTLPEQFRAAISLYYFEELSYREIAELLNHPLGTIKSNLHRGTRLLRQTLEIQKSR